MTIDHAIAPSQLMAEIAEIDVLLMQYEDWRALLQLESREKQGDAVRSVNGETLKGLLLESLSVNPLFARRQQLLADLEKMARDLQRLGPRTETPDTVPSSSDVPKPLQDDLTRISGIDARLAKRLKILNVRSFNQIANWTPDDVEYVSNTLGLDKLIGTEDWIGQAAQLAQSSETSSPASDAWVHARSDLRPPTASNATPMAAAPKSGAHASKPVVEAKVPVVASVAPSSVLPVVATTPTVGAAEKPRSPPISLSTVEMPPQAAPVPMAAPPVPTPASATARAGSTESPVSASVAVTIPIVPAAEVDASWKKLAPASPLAARVYKTESPPSAAAPLEAAKAAPVVAMTGPETKLVKLPAPAMPLAARHYQGAVLEPKHDGALYSGFVPAKPLAAPAYRTAATEAPAAPVAPVAGAASPAPLAAQPVAAQATSKNSDGKAADILQHTLPPLPLRPSAPPPAQPAMPQAQSPSQRVAAPAQSEALLLAVVAARSPLVASAAPPPIPAEVKNGKAASPVQSSNFPLAAPAARQTHLAPAVTTPQILDDVEPRSRQAAVEARVTIKRTDEALSSTVLRTPGGTEVHLGSRRGAQPDEFDGTSYAAYRGSIEEASVQIVRRPPATKAATKTPDAPPPLMPAATSAAQAAAQAIEAGRLPVADSGDVGPTSGSTMGRFLKALTGQ